MKNLKIEYLRTEDLIPYENNPRNNDDAVDYVANSIKEFGFKVPIIVDANNVIVAGHTRLKAAQKLGLEELPCVRADDLTEEQVKALRLADNKVGEIATWDLEKLELELHSIDLDMAEFGFDELGDMLLSDEGIDDDRYTKKINIPQYEITGECPELEELVNTEKADQLIREIDEAEVPESIKAFLRKAAYRHNVFNYKNIAEYYAHADQAVQELFEKSALVIIDYDDAIKNGYVALSSDIAIMEAEDDEK